MTWLKLVPAWLWWGLALLAVAGVQQLRVAGAQVEAAGAVSALADYRTEVSERDRKATLAALQETKRRMAAIDEVQKDAEQQLEAARADAADAGGALERLKLRLEAAERRSRDAGNTITAQLSQAAEADSRVRTELLGRLGALAQRYAGVADESRVAGHACERAYDALGGEG
jgi:chromosome segregation ATPase